MSIQEVNEPIEPEQRSEKTDQKMTLEETKRLLREQYRIVSDQSFIISQAEKVQSEAYKSIHRLKKAFNADMPLGSLVEVSTEPFKNFGRRIGRVVDIDLDRVVVSFDKNIYVLYYKDDLRLLKKGPDYTDR